MADRRANITWRIVGRGTRSHAFNPGHLDYAYCGIGPGDPKAEALSGHCRACEKRLARIAAQDAELDRLLA